MANETKKVNKRTLEGTVVSAKMQKTRIVEVTRLTKHARYHKYYKVTKRFAAHDPENAYAVGDKVRIEDSRPVSKTKRWTIIAKIEAK
jgi:small subunit ribosomal protein S17